MIYDIKRYHIMNPIGYPGPIQYLDNSDLKQFEGILKHHELIYLLKKSILYIISIQICLKK
jgi:hypothetical protein